MPVAEAEAEAEDEFVAYPTPERTSWADTLKVPLKCSSADSRAWFLHQISNLGLQPWAEDSPQTQAGGADRTFKHLRVFILTTDA
eukprot:620373-Alexandrium_andersonii.AAC.1